MRARRGSQGWTWAAGAKVIGGDGAVGSPASGMRACNPAGRREDDVADVALTAALYAVMLTSTARLIAMKTDRSASASCGSGTASVACTVPGIRFGGGAAVVSPALRREKVTSLKTMLTISAGSILR